MRNMTFGTFSRQYAPFLTTDPENLYFSVLISDEDGQEEMFEVRAASSDGLAIIKYFLFQLNGRPAKLPEVQEFLEILRGSAMTQPRRMLSNPMEELLEDDMQLTALGKVIDKIADEGGLRGGNGFLLQRIVSIAQRMGVADDENFPTTVDQLGTQLAALVLPMRIRGVIIERHDKARPREWTIHPRGYVPGPQGDESTR